MFPGVQRRTAVKVRGRVIMVGDVMMWGKRETMTGDERIQVSILNATRDAKIEQPEGMRKVCGDKCVEEPQVKANTIYANRMLTSGELDVEARSG
jgi:hypothetical protein